MSATTEPQTLPENLTLCSECGLPFPEPVDVDTALDYFNDVEEASFNCERCERVETIGPVTLEELSS
jgi:hypothetical protein